MTERLGREAKATQTATVVLEQEIATLKRRLMETRAAHDALAREVESWRILATRANERAEAAEQEVARLRAEIVTDRRLTQALADEKCRCFLVRAEAAEQRAGVLEQKLKLADEALERAGRDLFDVVMRNNAALTPPSQHGQVTGVLQPGTLPPLQWDDKEPA